MVDDAFGFGCGTHAAGRNFKRQTVAGRLGFASGKTGFTRAQGTATIGP